MFKRLFKFVLFLSVILTSASVFADQIRPILDVGLQRLESETSSQLKIDVMEDDTSLIINEYKQVSKQVEGLIVYNAQLRKQIQRQEERLKEIDKTLKEAQVMQRQIPPFTRRMLSGIETSIELDVPFHLAERKERMAFAKAALDNPTVSPAEGLRQVMEAFTVEAEYGRKLDAYKDTVEVDGNPTEVNILRIGRLALIAQTADESEALAWDNKTRSWVELGSSYRNPIRKGLRIAKRLATVDLLEMPVPYAEESK